MAGIVFLASASSTGIERKEHEDQNIFGGYWRTYALSTDRRGRRENSDSLWAFSQYYTCPGCDCSRAFTPGKGLVRTAAWTWHRNSMVYLQCRAVRHGSSFRRVA